MLVGKTLFMTVQTVLINMWTYLSQVLSWENQAMLIKLIITLLTLKRPELKGCKKTISQMTAFFKKRP